MIDFDQLKTDMYSRFNLSFRGKNGRREHAANAAFSIFRENIGKMSPHDMLDEVKYTMGINFIAWWLIRQFVWQVIIFLYNEYYSDTTKDRVLL